MKKNILKDFDIFINPNNFFDTIFNNYEYIDRHCIRLCSYVIFLVIPTINGEINGKPLIFDNITDCILIQNNNLYNECTIYAINYLDNISLEVN